MAWRLNLIAAWGRLKRAKTTPVVRARKTKPTKDSNVMSRLAVMPLGTTLPYPTPVTVCTLRKKQVHQCPPVETVGSPATAFVPSRE